MDSIQDLYTNDWSSGWDRTFLSLSSALAEPICSAYSLFRYRLVSPLDPARFDNCSGRAQEASLRALIGLGALLGVSFCIAAPLPAACAIFVLAGGSKLCRSIGFALQKDGYTHVRGEAAEKPAGDRVKVMSWNVCGVAGGFHYDHGGVIDWKARFKGISQKIETEDPDVLILEEIYDAALGEALIQRFKEKYAHFYFHMGKTVMGSVGGVMVLSKCGVHSFAHKEFATNDWQLKRGFAVIEIKGTPSDDHPAMRIIGTHFIHGNAQKDKSARVEQLAQIVDFLAKQKIPLPTLLAGDLNIERDGEEGRILLPYLKHGYTGSESTCTNQLVAQWDLKAKSVWSETIDYISLFKEQKTLAVLERGVEIEECHLSRAYDQRYNTKTALSDHHAVVATIHLSKEILDDSASATPHHSSGYRSRPYSRSA